MKTPMKMLIGAAIVLAVAFLFNQPYIALGILGAALVIPKLKMTLGMNMTTVVIVALVVVMGANIGGLYSSTIGTLGTGQVASIGMPAYEGQPSVGQLQSATLKLNVKHQDGTTYAGSGIIYALKSGIVSDRYSLMKMLYDGKTSDLTPNTMTLASGVESYPGFAGRVGDQITLAGYKDTTPAAAENVSFIKTVMLTGITGGSTPEWMISEPQFVWHNYPTLLFYDSTDTARTRYNESEATAVEKTFTLYMFPTNDGEQWINSALYIEAPSSNAGAFKTIKIADQDGKSVEYTSLQSTGQMSSSDPRFIAAPSLTTSTDTMYFVGKFPSDEIRTSSTQKAKMTLTVTYDHPASGSVDTYFKVVSNADALTSSGGHFDSPSTNMKFNMTVNTDAGSADLWG